MSRYRIILRQRGDRFICYVVEKRVGWIWWERMPFAFGTISDAEKYISGADDAINETRMKEYQ